MELIRDNVKVEWEAIGEGLSGDYNPGNPRDVALLRFYVSVLRDGVWEEKEDASCCTLFPAEATDEDKMAGLEILMKRFHEVLSAEPDASVKKLSEQLSWIGLDDLVNVSSGMSLRQFLSHFDFDYDIVSAGDDREARIRKELLEDGYLTAEDLDKDLICLVDKQNAYFGDIDKERYPVDQSSVSKIIDRMDVYIQDSIISEFEDALGNHGVDAENMDLANMVEKCKELGVGVHEVSYWMAGAVIEPARIFIAELRECEKGMCVEERIELALSRIEPDRFTDGTNAVLCLDSIKGVDVVCLDLCYDNNECLPVCDVVNLVQLPLTEDNAQFARQVLSNISERFQVSVRDEFGGSSPVYNASLDEQICAATSARAGLLNVSEISKELEAQVR